MVRAIVHIKKNIHTKTSYNCFAKNNFKKKNSTYKPDILINCFSLFYIEVFQQFNLLPQIVGFGLRPFCITACLLNKSETISIKSQNFIAFSAVWREYNHWPAY